MSKLLLCTCAILLVLALQCEGQKSKSSKRSGLSGLMKKMMGGGKGFSKMWKNFGGMSKGGDWGKKGGDWGGMGGDSGSMGGFGNMMGGGFGDMMDYGKDFGGWN